MKKSAFLVVLALLLSGPVRADVQVVLNSGPVTNGANFNWTYTLFLKSGSTLNTGDFFTLYDIGGFGPAVPIPNNVILPAANWSASIQNTGVHGFRQVPPDSAEGYNLTFTFTGTAIVAAVDTVLGGGAGAFGYISSHNTSCTGPYSATTHMTAGGNASGNTSTVTFAGPCPTGSFSALDIDANGSVDALTDGLLLTRYLLGLRGAALIQNALGAGATRTLATDIESHIAGLLSP